MTNSLKTVKILGLILVILAATAGGGFFLIKMEIVKAPAVLQRIPMPSFLQIKGEPGNSAPEDMIEKVDDLAAKPDEMGELQARLTANEQALQAGREKEIQLKEEVARLNQEILDLKTGDAAKRAAYKDMAPYFANMKAKDAADIMSRLKDEDIIGILSGMEKETAAEILSLMNRDKAAAITAKMLVVGT